MFRPLTSTDSTPAAPAQSQGVQGGEARSDAGAISSLLDLAHRAVSGDRAALESLLLRLHTRVSRVLSRRLGGDPYAEGFLEDATQEVLYRIAVSLKSCVAETDAQFLVWVAVISRNVAIDLLRANYSRYALVILMDSPDSAADRASFAEWGADEGESGTAKDLLIGILQSVATSLPDGAHRILWFRLVEGAPWPQVGAEIGTTAAGAKRRFQRIQQSLRSAVLQQIDQLPDSDRVRVLKWLDRVGYGPQEPQ